MAIPISFLQSQPDNERSKTKPPSNNPVVQQAFAAGLGADSATVAPAMRVPTQQVRIQKNTRRLGLRTNTESTSAYYAAPI
jgi:hypothetical protein